MNLKVIREEAKRNVAIMKAEKEDSVHLAIDLYHNIRAFSTKEKAEKFVDKQPDCFTWHIQTTKIDVV